MVRLVAPSRSCRSLRTTVLLGGALAATLAFATGCVDSYDAQPQVASYVMPPPPAAVPVGEQDAVAATAGAADAQGAPAEQVAAGDYADTDPSALQDFREPLTPYGTWVNDPSYGTVWVPREDVVGADFVPYQTAGHWDYDDDYVWVSDYSWGWAPFHYGRWLIVPGRGWVWIPGRAYSGAWVSWRTGGSGYGYVGWAPLAPSWYWYDGYAYGIGVSMWYAPRYSYCDRNYLFSRNVNAHMIRGRDANVHDTHTAVYSPASPSVNGRTAASPTVDSRTAANPSVNPAGGQHPGFSAGPPPKALGIDESHISKVSPADASSVARARDFATPAGALKSGAHAPAVIATTARAGSEKGTATASTSSGSRGALLSDNPVGVGPRYAPRTPTSGAPNEAITTHGAVRSTAIPHAAAPTPLAGAPTYGSRPTALAPAALPPRPTAASSDFAARAGQFRNTPNLESRAPSYTPSAVSHAPTYSPARPSFGSSSFGSSRSLGSGPSFSSHSAPSYSAPSRSMSSPSFSSHSAPSYSAPSRSMSSPSFSSHGSSPSFSSSRSFGSSSLGSSRSFSAPSRSSSSSFHSSGGHSSGRGHR